VHDTRGQVLASTVDLGAQIPGSVPQVVRVLAENHPAGLSSTSRTGGSISTRPPSPRGEADRALTLSHDASYIDVRLEEIWRHNLIRVLILFVLVVAITLIVVRWEHHRSIAQVAGWMRDCAREKPGPSSPRISEDGRVAGSPDLGSEPDGEKPRHRAGKGRKGIQPAGPHGTALDGRPPEGPHARGARRKKLYLVSNREPYMHEKDGSGIDASSPRAALSPHSIP